MNASRLVAVKGGIQWSFNTADLRFESKHATSLTAANGNAVSSAAVVRVVAGNVANSYTHSSGIADSITIGRGRGGGVFALKSQIGSVEIPLDAAFDSNEPTGIHSSRSSMFLVSPMKQYADGIVVGVRDFPFPVPRCPPG